MRTASVVTVSRAKPKRAQFVFRDAVMWTADGANDPLFEILLTSHVVNGFVSSRIVKHAVDREVAAQCILLRRTELNMIRASTIGVAAIGSERSDFDLALRLVVAQHNDHTEACTNGDGLTRTEELNHFVGSSGCGNVIVFGRDSQQCITDTAAGPDGFKPSVTQTLNDMQREISKVRIRDVQTGSHGVGIRVEALACSQRIEMCGR